MITITEDELKEIISNHEKWLKRGCPDDSLMRASLINHDLSGVCLSGVIFIRANLTGADLTHANLAGANLTDADLSYANLAGADLVGANLTGANLTGANLTGAYLTRANLTDARLTRANLSGSDLTRANLTNSNLIDSYLTRVNLCDADLNGATLTGADLNGACLVTVRNCPYIPMACPDEGGFFGYKRCGTAIVKLYIPADAKRSSSTGRKCRCSRAFVCDIQSLSTGQSLDSVRSDWNYEFVYKLHTFVEPKEPFCENRFIECGSGIHFYMNREEAINHGKGRFNRRTMRFA